MQSKTKKKQKNSRKKRGNEHKLSNSVPFGFGVEGSTGILVPARNKKTHLENNETRDCKGNEPSISSSASSFTSCTIRGYLSLNHLEGKKKLWSKAKRRTNQGRTDKDGTP